MSRYLWGQLWHRGTRTLAVVLGILIATTSFTVLTGTSRTSELRVTGTVRSSFRSAYDILVRPPRSTTSIERASGLVQGNYLSGIFGGISLDQFREVKSVPGVDVAAPVANLGYVDVIEPVLVDLRGDVSNDPVQLYRIRPTFQAVGARSRYPDADGYVYFTRRAPFVGGNVGQAPRERAPNGQLLDVCGGYYAYISTINGLPSVFDVRSRSAITCFSTRTPGLPQGANAGAEADLPTSVIGYRLNFVVPLLLAAIDPDQERRLVGLDRTVVSGRTLTGSDAVGTYQLDAVRALPGGGSSHVLETHPIAPVMASVRTYLDERLHVQVDRLRIPPGLDVPRMLASVSARQGLTTLPGEPLSSRTVTATDAYRRLLSSYEHAPQGVGDYLSPGAVAYESDGTRLMPQATSNPASNYGAFYVVPFDNLDTQFRRVTNHPQTNCTAGCARDGGLPIPYIKLVGQFDPRRLPGFNPLSEVPLESYRPPEVTGADEGTRRLLNDRPLGPDRNVGGYIAQPPLLLTSLQSLPAFTRTRDPLDSSNTAPVSVIRVRVAGVRGPDALSRERVNQAALEIRRRTGLDVDVTIGSSPAPQTVLLPSGKFGRPQMLVEERWVKKGVAVTILSAVDRKSLVLFSLILVVCGLFVTNAAAASVRARRTELGVLACIGWSAGRLYTAILGELAILGLLAGSVGALLAVPLTRLLNQPLSGSRLVIAIPAASVLAVLAGLQPGFRAAHAVPADAVRPAVSAGRRGRPARSVLRLAISNLTRLPGRTAVGAAALAVGVAALTILLAITLAFRGVLVGSLLGDAIAIRIRSVDYVAASAAIALGGLSVADVLYLNVRERAPELAILRATGWTDAVLSSLVVWEGVGIGLIGALTGTAVGLAAATSFTGVPLLRLLPAAVAASVVGVAITAAASAVPVLLLRNMSTAPLLAEE